MSIFSWVYAHKKQLIALGALIVIVGIIALRGKKTDATEIFIVSRADISQTVQLTGSLTPQETVDLGFERSGRVLGVFSKVGDTVRKGQLLATLSSGPTGANFNAAKAQAASAASTLNQFNQKLIGERSRLEELRAGARKEEISAQDIEVFKAYTTLDTNISDFAKSLEQLFLLVDRIINVDIAPLFYRVNSQSYRVTFESCDPQALTDVIDQRYKIDLMFFDWQKRRSAVISQNAESLRNLAVKSQENIFQIEAFLSRLSQALLACNSANSAIVSVHATINTSRDSLKNAVGTMLNAQNVVDNQTLTIKKLLTQRDLSAGSARDEHITAQKSTIAQVEAQIASQKAQISAAESQIAGTGAVLAQGSIRAPFAGILTKNSLQKGGLSQGLVTVMTIISDAVLKIDSFVPETDIGKLRIGQTGNVTLDAYGSDVIFEAQVVQIEPAETKIEGVATYKTTFVMTKRDSRALPGMTANITITTERKIHVLHIPSRALMYEGEQRFVRLIDEKNFEIKMPVSIGLRGENGMVEVVGGLKEGDKITW